MRLQIISCVLALAACGKADSAAPKAEPVAKSEEPASATPKPAAPAARKGKALPPGPANILPVNAYDPCSLVPDDLLKKLFGGVPTEMRRQRRNTDPLRRDDESQVVCEWSLEGKRAEVRFGSDHATSTAGDKRQEDVSGLGEAAWMVKGFSDEQKLRVKVGDRFLVAQSSGLGDQKAAAIAMGTAAIAALPTVVQLNDRLRAGDLVGGPAVKPCDLMSSDALAAAAGGGDFVTMPDEQTSHRPGRDRVSCEWVTEGERSAEIQLSRATMWEDLAPRVKEKQSVAGHEALFSDGIGQSLYIKMDGWTLILGVNDVDTPKTDKQARLLVLAEAVLARLPR